MEIKKTLRSFWKEFIYGGHLLAIGAASIVFSTSFLLNLKITWDSLFVAYLMFYPLYLYNRYKEIEIDYLTNPKRTEYLKTYIHQAPIIISILILTLIVSFIYFSNIWALIFGALLVLFGLLYSTIFKKYTKKIPFFKNFYVSSFFASLVFFFVIYYSYPLKTLIIPVLLFSIFVYSKAFMMQILLDLKDLESDEKEELLTFPSIFRRKKTFNYLKIISVITTASIPLIFSVYFNIFPKSILLLLLTIPFNFYCFKKTKEHNYFGYILASGEFVLWSFLLLIGEFIL